LIRPKYQSVDGKMKHVGAKARQFFDMQLEAANSILRKVREDRRRGASYLMPQQARMKSREIH
jgi:hypothetical protein